MTTVKAYYSLQDVAKMLHISRQTLYKYVHSGKLEAVKIGKQYRVTSDAIAQFIDNNRAN